MAYQDNGLFSARRPRETLGGINGNMSSLPMPSSAMKRSSSVQAQAGGHSRSVSGGRMSLAPGRPSQPIFQRSSSGSNLADMGGFQSVGRQSMGVGFGSAGGRKSFAPGGNMGFQTPASQPHFNLETQRRSSTFKARSSSGVGAQMGAMQSFFATTPAPAGQINDPRRIRDAGTRHQMAHELTEFLTMNNFEMDQKHQLSQKAMSSPTQKDFNNMFMWLYKRIDPAYRFQKSLEQEVPLLLKQMRYPFEKNITKSQIAAVGGNNWYTFLALLHWMMQLAKMMEQYSVGTYDEASIEDGFDVTGDRIMWDFLSESYRAWGQVEGDEDDAACIPEPDDDEETRKRKEQMAKDQLIKHCQPQIDAMQAKFEQANEEQMDTLRTLEAAHKDLQSQIDELSKNGPRITKLDEQIKILEEDRGKFEQYNQTMENKVDRYENRCKLLDDEIQKIEKELEQEDEEKSRLQEMIDQQGITLQDIDRLNSERERLQRSLESAATRMDESKKRVSEKEFDASQKLDELERVVEKYNSLGYQVGVIPNTASNANGQDYELTLLVNDGPTSFRSSQLGSSQQSQEAERLLADSGNGYQPHHLLNLDLKGHLKNQIVTLRKEIRERRNKNLESDMNNHDLLDKVKEVMDEKQQEVEALGHRVRAAEEEFEKTREITTAQKMASDTQVERMEKELSKMRASLSENVQVMEQRELNTNIEYEQLTLRAASLREDLHTEVERVLNDVIKFKIHVQTGLEEYEGFISDEVQRQMEEQENGGQEVDHDQDEEYQYQDQGGDEQMDDDGEGYGNGYGYGNRDDVDMDGDGEEWSEQ